MVVSSIDLRFAQYGHRSQVLWELCDMPAFRGRAPKIKPLQGLMRPLVFNSTATLAFLKFIAVFSCKSLREKEGQKLFANRNVDYIEV